MGQKKNSSRTEKNEIIMKFIGDSVVWNHLHIMFKILHLKKTVYYIQEFL